MSCQNCGKKIRQTKPQFFQQIDGAKVPQTPPFFELKTPNIFKGGNDTEKQGSYLWAEG
jgi:hypothetical protein